MTRKYWRKWGERVSSDNDGNSGEFIWCARNAAHRIKFKIDNSNDVASSFESSGARTMLDRNSKQGKFSFTIRMNNGTNGFFQDWFFFFNLLPPCFIISWHAWEMTWSNVIWMFACVCNVHPQAANKTDQTSHISNCRRCAVFSVCACRRNGPSRDERVCSEERRTYTVGTVAAFHLSATPIDSTSFTRDSCIGRNCFVAPKVSQLTCRCLEYRQIWYRKCSSIDGKQSFFFFSENGNEQRIALRSRRHSVPSRRRCDEWRSRKTNRRNSHISLRQLEKKKNHATRIMMTTNIERTNRITQNMKYIHPLNENSSRDRCRSEQIKRQKAESSSAYNCKCKCVYSVQLRRSLAHSLVKTDVRTPHHHRYTCTAKRQCRRRRRRAKQVGWRAASVCSPWIREYAMAWCALPAVCVACAPTHTDGRTDGWSAVFLLLRTQTHSVHSEATHNRE